MLAASLYLIYEWRFLAIGAPDRGAGILLSWTTLTSPHLPADYLSITHLAVTHLTTCIYLLSLCIFELVELCLSEEEEEVQPPSCAF